MLELGKYFESRNHLRHVMLTGLIIACSFIFACGGGGSDGSSENQRLSYTGNTEAAQITDTNAREVASDAFQGAATGESMNPFQALQVASESATGRPISLKLFETLEDVLVRADIQGRSGDNARALETATDSLTGDCGSGQATYSIAYDEVTGVFSGTFTFTSFCNDGTTFSGATTFSGKLDTSGTGNELFEYFSFSFYDLTMTSDSLSYTLEGDLTFTIESNLPTVTLNIFIQDNLNNQVAWIDDYSLVRDGQYLDITGTFYHPQHGRITIETPTRLYYEYWQEYPSQGIIVFSGAPGSAGGPTKVQIEALSSGTCRVTADTDGDGFFTDYDSGEIAWEALDD